MGLDQNLIFCLNWILENCRYLLAIAILSSLYSGVQVFRQVHELSTGKQLIKPRLAAMIDFFGDQVCLPFIFFYDHHIIDFYGVITFFF